MPTVWKVTFEEPLIRLIQSGQISNSKQLVDAIALYYDISIRQGLPNPPGTPGGPLSNGNILVFKKFLNAFYKLESSKQKILVVAVFSKNIKTLLQAVKENVKEISKKRKELRELIREQSKNLKEISKLKRINTSFAKKKLIELSLKNVKLLKLRNEILQFIQDKKEIITEFIKPKIASLKAQLRDIITKLAIPSLQASKLKLLKSIPRLVKTIIKEIKEKKKFYLDLIKTNIKKVNELSKVFKKIKSAVSKENIAKLKKSINSLIKSISIASAVKAGTVLVALISNLPESKIGSEVLAACRSAVNKILNIKIEILNLKEQAKEFLLTKIQERRADLLNAFKPKNISRVLELRERVKELRRFISELKSLLPRLREAKKIVSSIRSELSKLRKFKDVNKLIPNKQLASLLNKLLPGQGSKYLQITTVQAAKAFLAGVLIAYISSNEQLLELRTKFKENIQSIRDKILSQRFNPREIIFNSFLRLAITGYWTGGVMVNPATPTVVLSPGVVSLQASLKPTANPANFIRSLSKVFQAHTLTVGGTFTVPGTPPVVSPWVGYK